MNADARPWPSPRVAWYLVLVLAVANAVSFIDRLILSLLIPEVKAELNLSDTQVSLLQGLAFAVFYSLMGLPLARIADAFNRKYLILAGIAVWSLMTALCGVAKGYGQLFLARMGVGVGEASLSPSAYSMLSDSFPPQKLALPIGVFSAGVTAGMGLAFIAGAAAIQWVTSLGSVVLPVVGELSGWRLVMVIVGSLGAIVIALMAFAREPARRDGATTRAERSVPLNEVWAQFLAHRSLYLLVFIGYGMTTVAAFGIVTWTPTFYIRSFGLTAPEAGYLLGTVALLGGVSGAVLGGLWADALAKRGDELAKLRVLLYCCIGLVPAGVLSPLMPNVWAALALLFFTFFFGSACSGPTGSFVQILTPSRMRAQFGAAYQLSLSLIGLSLGPTAVALMTDFVFRDEMMLRYSLAWVVAIFNPIAVLLVWLALRHRRQVLTHGSTRRPD